MSHTNGKLETRGYYAVNELGRAVFDCAPIPMEEEEIKANVRRLVACWNACDGAETSSLERGLSGHPQPILNLARRNHALLEERDELLDHLKIVSEYIRRGDDTDARSHVISVLANYPKAKP